MGPRPACETIAILRRTLEQVEKDFDPLLDALPLNELKRTILRRIAELELPEGLQIASVTEIVPEASARTESHSRESELNHPELSPRIS
jgi:hypothetical protein